MKMIVLKSLEVGGKVWFCKNGAKCTVMVADVLDDAPVSYISCKATFASVEYTVTREVGNDFYKQLIEDGFLVDEIVRK